MMKEALISPDELVYSYDGTVLGERVAQVEPEGATFPVAAPLFWVSCADDVVQDEFYWNGNACVAIPTPPLAAAQKPTTTVTGTGGPNVVA
jgi:hypothetical protein